MQFLKQQSFPDIPKNWMIWQSTCRHFLDKSMFQKGAFNFYIESTPAVWNSSRKVPFFAKPFYSAQYSFYRMKLDCWVPYLLKRRWQESIFPCRLNYQSIWRIKRRQANANAVVSKQQSFPDIPKNWMIWQSTCRHFLDAAEIDVPEGSLQFLYWIYTCSVKF